MSLQYTSEEQQKVNTVISQEVAAVGHGKRDILRSIHESTHDLSVTGDQRISLTQARFATLLVSLSEQADKTTQEIVALTRWLLGLTVALLFFTAYLSYDVYTKSKGDDQTKPNATQK